jgi:HSP20 family protein
MSEFTIDIEKQLNKLGRDLQNFVERIVPLEDKGQDFTPACDIIESEKEFRILMDLPGIGKKEINVGIRENVLTVKGERSQALEENEHFKRRERSMGVFSRSFALPEHVKTDEVDARFRNGVLAISMPKLEGVDDAQSIPIK